MFPETRYSTALERFLKRVPSSIIIESRDLLVFPNLNISFVIFLVQHESFRVHFFHPSSTMSCALFSFQNLYLNQIKIIVTIEMLAKLHCWWMSVVEPGCFSFWNWWQNTILKRVKVIPFSMRDSLRRLISTSFAIIWSLSFIFSFICSAAFNSWILSLASARLNSKWITWTWHKMVSINIRSGQSMIKHLLFLLRTNFLPS